MFRYILLFILTLFTPEAIALITGGSGNAALEDRGWPTGSLEVANDLSRAAWWEGPPFGGGEHHFEHRGDAAVFNDVLKAFAKIRTPKRELVIHDGVHESFWLKLHGGDTKIDWTFIVWHPASWHRLYNNPRSSFASDQPNFRQPVAAPRIDVYVDGEIDWDSVVVPKGIEVIDQRASALGIMQKVGVLFRGTVHDMSTGKVIGGARVVVEKTKGHEKLEDLAEVRTNEKGEFLIEDLPAEMLRVYVATEGYATRQIAHQAFQDKTFQTFEVELVEAGSIAGVAIDEKGQPLVGAKVRLTNPLAINGRGYVAPGMTEVETDERGQFKLNDVPTGYTRLRCLADEHYHNYFGELYDVPSDGIRLTVVRTGLVKVNVVDIKGEPVTENFMVNIEAEGGPKVGSWGGSANIQADGTYTFKGVPPGRYLVSGRPNPGSSKYEPDEKLVNVESGATTDVQILRK